MPLISFLTHFASLLNTPMLTCVFGLLPEHLRQIDNLLPLPGNGFSAQDRPRTPTRISTTPSSTLRVQCSPHLAGAALRPCWAALLAPCWTCSRYGRSIVRTVIYCLGGGGGVDVFLFLFLLLLRINHLSNPRPQRGAFAWWWWWWW